MTTTSMQMIASRKFQFAPAHSLAVAEGLYQKGLLSYPRTETEIFPESMDLAALVREQILHPQWGGFAQQVLANGVNPRTSLASTYPKLLHPPLVLSSSRPCFNAGCARTHVCAYLCAHPHAHLRPHLNEQCMLTWQQT